jgi:predicted CxxxxCH...CXXCH cytochrome family protein
MRPGRIAILCAFAVGCGQARAVDGPRCVGEDCVRVHPVGIADVQSPDFHGKLIQSLGWNFALCQQCHGEDFSGGTAERTCNRSSCHDPKEGPTGCTTCHGQPPQVGAHQAHARFGCGECHVKPSRYSDPGHLFRADGSVLTAPTVTFGALAHQGGAQPTWDGATCSDVYCHGATLGDAHATSTRPSWFTPGSAGCGSCHGLPPSNHARSDCATCHPKVIDATGTLLAGARHVDGQVSLGDESGTCQACHPVLSGAHGSHTTAAHGLRPPLACGECHRAPTQVDDPGHIDHEGVIVFPEGTSALARTDGAIPTWSEGSGTCSDVYCHGGGALAATDQAAGLFRMPAWTVPRGAECGSCHGVPPGDATHAAPMTFADCHGCHSATIDANGTLLSGTMSHHMNGVVDHD